MDEEHARGRNEATSCLEAAKHFVTKFFGQDVYIDPYVKVVERHSQIIRTTDHLVDHDDADDAVWHQTLKFALAPSTEEIALVFQLWDHDVGDDDFLGFAELDTAAVNSYFAPPLSEEGSGEVAIDVDDELSKIMKLELHWEGEHRGDLYVSMAKLPDDVLQVKVLTGHDLHNPAKSFSQANDRQDAKLQRKG